MRNILGGMVGRTDSYKLGHWNQYPPDCSEVLSYAEARGGRFDYTCFFGLQYYIKEYLVDRITRDDVEAVRERAARHFGNDKIFNYNGWMYIVEEHGGRLPVDIRAVREGSCVPTSNVVMTIRNTDPRCPWLTSYLETMLLKVWYTSTVATLSREAKRVLASYLKKTGTPDKLPFMLHDFGYRGVSSEESADLGGMAHLVNFQGTDTFHAILAAEEYYRAVEMPAFSVPATEHSVMTINGREGELETIRRLLKEYPEGILSIVSDSYNIYEACRHIFGTELKADVLARDGVTVIRPDSGANIVNIVINCLEILGERFGVTTNDKNYKVINDKVRVLQGDGLDLSRIQELCEGLDKHHWSLDNIATLGMGGGLLQKVNRDTQQWALKCCSAVVGDERKDVYKEPITAESKNSKRGWLDLIHTVGGPDGEMVYKTIDRDSQSNREARMPSELVPYYLDGDRVISQTFDEIRERAALHEHDLIPV